MNLYIILMKLEERLWNLKMSKTKKTYLNIKEIQGKMRNNEPIPTSIFSATKTDYIVKPKTIHGPKLVKKRTLKSTGRK